MTTNIESQGTKDMVFSLDQCYLDQWFKQNRLIGSDPEAMILDIYNRVIPASGIIDDPNYEEPIGMDKAGDPMEFRPKPSTNVKDHLKNLQHLIDSAYNHFYDNPRVAKLMAKPITYRYSIGGHLQVDMPYIESGKIENLGTMIQTILSPCVFMIEGKSGFTRRHNAGYGRLTDVRSDTRRVSYNKTCSTCKAITSSKSCCTSYGSYSYLSASGWINKTCTCKCHTRQHKTVMELRMFGSWLYDMNLAKLLMDSTIELSVLPTKTLNNLHDLIMTKPDNTKYTHENILYRTQYFDFSNNGLKTLLKVNGLPCLKALALKALKYKAKTYNVFIFRDHLAQKEESKLSQSQSDYLISTIHAKLKDLLESKNLWLKKEIHLYGLKDRVEDPTRDMYINNSSTCNIGLTRMYRDVTDPTLIVNRIFDNLSTLNLLKSAKQIKRKKSPKPQLKRKVINPVIIAEASEDCNESEHCENSDCHECNRAYECIDHGDTRCMECS